MHQKAALLPLEPLTNSINVWVLPRYNGLMKRINLRARLKITAAPTGVTYESPQPGAVQLRSLQRDSDGRPSPSVDPETPLEDALEGDGTPSGGSRAPSPSAMARVLSRSAKCIMARLQVTWWHGHCPDRLAGQDSHMSYAVELQAADAFIYTPEALQPPAWHTTLTYAVAEIAARSLNLLRHASTLAASHIRTGTVRKLWIIGKLLPCRLSPKKLQRRTYTPLEEPPHVTAVPVWAGFEGPTSHAIAPPSLLEHVMPSGHREDDVMSERSVMSAAPNLMTSPLSSVHGGILPNR